LIEHVGFEVSDLERTAQFYDAVFFTLGARRLLKSEHLIAYGVNAPLFFFVTRSHPPRPPAPGYGHLALSASGKAAVDAAYGAGLANGGADDGPPGQRPQYGRRYYAAYLLDPDRLRVEIVSRR
jgi:catechol 2,3-dioxygenase-like lactoylglutathione lyase family enzyme